MDHLKLLLRFLREEASPAEQAELDTWAATAPENSALFEELQNPDLAAAALSKLDQLNWQEVWARVESYGHASRPPFP